jgi:hypothetical protein
MQGQAARLSVNQTNVQSDANMMKRKSEDETAVGVGVLTQLGMPCQGCDVR